MSAENISILNAKLQIQILDLEDELTDLKTKHVISIDENQEIAAELAIMKKKYEDEKNEALEELRAKHFDEIIELRKELHEEAIGFFMSNIVKEMKKTGMNQTIIYNNVVRKRHEFSEDLGSLFKVNLKRPMKTRRQRLQKNLAEKARKYFEETKAEREADRKRKHDDLEWEDIWNVAINKDERIRLQKLIEEQQEEEKKAEAEKEYYFEQENPKRARLDTDCEVEIDIPRFGDDQAEHKHYNQNRVLDPNQGLDFFSDFNVFIHKNMEQSLEESDLEAEEENN